MTDNSKKRKKAAKIIKLIIWLLVLVLLIFFGVKTCNITLTTHALNETSNEIADNSTTQSATEQQEPITNFLNKIITIKTLETMTALNTTLYLNNGRKEESEPPAINILPFEIFNYIDNTYYDELRLTTTQAILRRYTYTASEYYNTYYDFIVYDANASINTPFTFTQLRSNAPDYSLINSNFDLNITYQVINNCCNISNTIAKIKINDIQTTTGTSPYNIIQHEQDFIIIDNVNIYGFETRIEMTRNNTNNITTKGFIFYNTPVNYRDINTTDLSNYYISYEKVLDTSDNKSYIDLVLTLESGEQTFYTSQKVANWQSYGYKNGETVLNVNNIINDIINPALTYQKDFNFLEGKRAGWSEGYRDGYDNGYEDGVDDAGGEVISANWVLSIMNTATSILNIEIFPGFKIIYLVGAFVILAFVRFVIGWLR